MLTSLSIDGGIIIMLADQLRLEYQAIKRNEKIAYPRPETFLRRADFKGLMEQFARRTQLSVALEFSNKVLVLPATDEALVGLQTEIGHDLRGNAEALNQMRNLRQENPAFLGLLDGCLQPSEGLKLQFQRFRCDWQRLKNRLNGVPFFDPAVAKEAAYLECICRIFHYYYKSMAEDIYEETKKVVLALINQWEAEDIISENPTAQLVFSNFMTRGKGSRLDKELASHDDVATNHSSNQKIIKCTLMSSFNRKRNARGVPFESEASLPEGLPVKKLKDDKQLFDRTTLSRSNGLILEPRTLTLAPRNQTKRRSMELPRSSTLSTIPLVDMAQEESENENILANSTQESRFARNEMSGPSLYEKARQTTKNRLTEMIAEYCHPKLARCYAKKLEAELFSQYFSCLQEYILQSRRLAVSLRAALAKEGIADSLMTTAFEYHQIVSLAEKLSCPEPCQQNSPSDHKSLRVFSSTTQESSILDVEPAEMFRTGRCQMLSGDSMMLEEESNSQLIREVTRVKELQILQLKTLINKLESENSTLRSTLSKVRACLTHC